MNSLSKLCSEIPVFELISATYKFIFPNGDILCSLSSLSLKLSQLTFMLSSSSFIIILTAYTLWTCQKVCEALTFLLDNMYIRFGIKLFRQTVGVPMGTNCAPLVADLFLFCYERDFIMSLSVENQSEIIEAFSSTSRYLDDLLNIDNTYFDGLICQIYTPPPPRLPPSPPRTSVK